MLREQAPGLIESFCLDAVLDDLKLRLEMPAECATSGRLTRGILSQLNAGNPLQVEPGEFNAAAEQYYREILARQHFAEALDYLERDVQRLDQVAHLKDATIREGLAHTVGGQGAVAFLRRVKTDLLDDRLDLETMRNSSIW